MRSACRAMEDCGKNGPSPAACGNLSDVYFSLGEYRKALEFALQALSLSRKIYGEDSRETALAYVLTAESCLADSLESPEPPENSGPGIYPGSIALGYLRRAAEILEQHRPEDPEQLSLVYGRLAMVYDMAGKAEKAMEYGRKAMVTASRAFPPEHPAVLDALDQLAVLYDHGGQHEKACSYSREILRRRRRNEPPEELTEDLWADILMGLPRGQMPEPQELRELMTALEQEPETIAWLPQEELRLQFLRQMRNQREFCYQAALHGGNACSPEEMYDFTLKTNNAEAQISYAQAHFFRFTAEPELRRAEEHVRQLQQKRSRYLREDGTDAYRLYQLNREVENARTELLRRMEGVSLPAVGTEVSVSQVQSALPPGEAILEYGRFLWTEALKDYRNGEGTDHYFGFCVTEDRVAFRDLGEAETADRQIQELRRAIAAEEPCKARTEQLYRVLAAPFEEELQGKKSLIIVPDSTLYKLPFELLTDSAGASLGDRFSSVRYASSGREVLRPGEKIEPAEAGIALIADPQYDLPGEGNSSGNKEQEHRRSAGMAPPPGAGRITQLPFAKTEAEEIAALFGDRARLFTGIRATKHALEERTEARILHISTHGFACEPQPRAPVTESPGRRSRGRHLQQAEDPLLRCGLLFAGAGNWLRGEWLPENYGDGILTGSDLLTMDLSRYRLLVLSACRTGLGQTRSGEGIKGLRRAFELAGVGSMVCTLWEVDDFASAVLMRRFYEELLAGPSGGAAEALSRAKEFMRTVSGAGLLEMGWKEHIMELHTLGARTATGENYANYIMTREHPFAHPRYWAGYILQG